MILVRMNHRELTTESKRTSDSIIRFCRSKESVMGRLSWHDNANLCCFFQEYLIILAQRNTEDDGCDVFKAVNPLLSFTSLAANVKHTVEVISFCTLSLSQVNILYAELAHGKPRLIDTGSLCSCP